ncbi:amidohydrolase [Fredinandcohnia sp. 179-A 10B2 NHS]|uniref:amidohydrolase n=1 Tax=Fredinandcohnia sp. 179-A 10B2 NHS TaxID=3235176 RepID=UPI0039A380A7
MGTLWTGGQAYTFVKENEKVEAVFVENGIIIATGQEAVLRKQFQDRVKHVVDIVGCTMYPGFVDSHMHIIGHGEKLMKLDFSEMTTSHQLIDAIKEHVSKANKGEWITGEGWNENILPDQKIFKREELDELSPNNPLVLKRICRHAIIVNSTALELAGITDETPDPVGGVIVRDEAGKATGYLKDRAQDLVMDVIPTVSEDYLKQALTLSIKNCLELGLVGAHTEDLHYYGGFHRTFHAFQQVIDGQKVKFRTNLLVHHEAVDDMHHDGYSYKDGTEFVEFGAMKIFADGALGGRTALLSQPYNDSPDTSGVAIHSLQELKSLVKKAREYKMPIAVHAIGDLAFEYVIDVIEEYPGISGQRDRLIHAQILRKDLIERAKNLPIILDIQPRFVVSDFPWVIDRIGEENFSYCYAWKTLLKEGFHCAGGSDAPIEPVNPLLGIHAAVTRKNPDDKDSGSYIPKETLSMFEAISLFTTGSAYAIGQEDRMGKIAPGYKADFTILDKDLFSIPEDEIIDVKVMKTVVDNTIMFERKRKANKAM